MPHTRMTLFDFVWWNAWPCSSAIYWIYWCLSLKPYLLFNLNYTWLYVFKSLFFFPFTEKDPITKEMRAILGLWPINRGKDQKKNYFFCLDFVYFTFVQLPCSICYKAYFITSKCCWWELIPLCCARGHRFKSSTSHQLCWGRVQRYKKTRKTTEGIYKVG